MRRSAPVTFMEDFTHTDGCTYRRYRLNGTGQCTDVKTRIPAGDVLYSDQQAEAEARRRLSSRRWAHPHLVRP